MGCLKGREVRLQDDMVFPGVDLDGPIPGVHMALVDNLLVVPFSITMKELDNLVDRLGFTLKCIGLEFRLSKEKSIAQFYQMGWKGLECGYTNQNQDQLLVQQIPEQHIGQSGEKGQEGEEEQKGRRRS